MAAVSLSLDRQQVELQACIRELTAPAVWSEQDRARFVQRVFQSSPNSDYDRQITSITTELRGMLQAVQRNEIKGEEANRRFVLRLRELAGQLDSVSRQQTSYLTRQLRAARPAQRP